jgi:hypothetical protein
VYMRRLMPLVAKEKEAMASDPQNCWHIGSLPLVRLRFPWPAQDDLAIFDYRYRSTTATTSGKSMPSRFSVSILGTAFAVQPRRAYTASFNFSYCASR